MKHWIAEQLRRLADRIDYAGAPKRTSWSFTFEYGKGAQFNQDGRGCPLWYRGDADYERAHNEAITWAQDVSDGKPAMLRSPVIKIGHF